MRIISDKHDYYDCIQATGQDLDLVYVRKEEEVEIGRDYPFPVLKLGHTRGADARIYRGVIGFCGKIYPFLEIELEYGAKSHFCYNLDDVDALFKNHCKKKQIKYYFKTDNRKYRHFEFRPFHRRKSFEKFFNEYVPIQENFEDLFRLRKSPIFTTQYRERVHTSYTITFNTILKDYEFFRIFDTYTAYQEISMYLGGVLGVNTKPIPEVSDKDLASAKGFTKWSFRTPPKGK